MARPLFAASLFLAGACCYAARMPLAGSSLYVAALAVQLLGGWRFETEKEEVQS
jgi:hypothetical protein